MSHAGFYLLLYYVCLLHYHLLCGFSSQPPKCAPWCFSFFLLPSVHFSHSIWIDEMKVPLVSLWFKIIDQLPNSMSYPAMPDIISPCGPPILYTQITSTSFQFLKYSKLFCDWIIFLMLSFCLKCSLPFSLHSWISLPLGASLSVTSERYLIQREINTVHRFFFQRI